MEILPLDDVVPTDWSMEEAMRFIVTGGASAPKTIPYKKGAKTLAERIRKWVSGTPPGAGLE